MKAISLFSGVGGFEQGLDRAGIETILQVEQDPHALSILARHWPDTERLTDVRQLTSRSNIDGEINEASQLQRSRNVARTGHSPDVERERSDADRTAVDLRNANGPSGSERDRSAGEHGSLDRGLGAGSGADLIYGGFPCQDVSVAGKRGGLAAERSGLWFEFERILSELRPRWALIENVPGLLSSNNGNDFRVILNGLCELGYSVGWTILDAQNFGVPQRRRRVFVIAGPGVESVRAVLSLCESCSGDTKTSGPPGEEVAGTLGGGSQSGERGYRNDLDGNGAFPAGIGGRETGFALRANPSHSGDKDDGGVNTTYVVPDTASTLRSRQSSEGVNMPGRGGEDDANLVVEEQAMMFDSFNFTESDQANTVVDDKYRKDYVVETTGALPASLENGLGNTQTDVAGMLIAATIDTDPERHIGRGDGSENLVMGSLDTHLGDKQWLEDQSVEKFGQMEDAGAGVRRLTPRECERLMGWADDWTRWDANGKEIADSHRYRMCGNGVVSPVAEWIGRQLLAVNATL
jgi:DNA (cytosine-5)-methyltransferase 1